MPKISADLAIARLDATTARLDAGAAVPAATIVIYERDPGANPFANVPADTSAAITTQVPLLVFTLSNPSYAAATLVGSLVSASLNAVAPVKGVNAGNAGFFRLYNRDNACAMQGTVDLSPTNPGELKLSSVLVTTDAFVSLLELKLKEARG